MRGQECGPCLLLIIGPQQYGLTLPLVCRRHSTHTPQATEAAAPASPGPWLLARKPGLAQGPKEARKTQGLAVTLE